MSQEASAAAERSPNRSAAQHGAGRCIVVVEDEPNISEAIRFILRRDGWAVTLVDTGDRAVETVVAQQPALLILDMMLPGQTGFDVLGVLRRDPRYVSLPVILLTAKGQAYARDKALAAGASLFMAKPFANQDLLDAVRRLVTD